MFIRDQIIEWCHHDFIDAAQESKPDALRFGIDRQLDWYAVWRAL